MLTETDIALIEAHDARVEAISLPMNGSCEIRFKHLLVYKSRGGERFVIWSYRAALELQGVARVVVEESSSKSDYVSDAVVCDEAGEVPWLRLLKPQSVKKLTMTFGSGRRIDLDCGQAKLVLQDAVRELEEWNGPLIGQS